MSYWAREIGGWAVLLLGLGFFGLAYLKLGEKRIFDAGPLTVIGFVVFRGGLHLLKVAVAARAARDVTASAPAAPPARRPFPPAARSPRSPTDPRRAVPGPTPPGGLR